MADKAKPAAKKDKKFSKSSLFESKGATAGRKNKYCPKCGPGVYLAKHATRESCGNCGYTEWKAKSA